jgi:hypothetical protein
MDLIQREHDGATLSHRPLCAIAQSIKDNWSAKYDDAKRKPDFYIYGKQSVIALMDLETPLDYYYAEDGKSILIYLISRIDSWRGEYAKAIKAELKEIYDFYVDIEN